MKSAIYVVNTSTLTGVNGVIPLGTTIRRFGKNLEQSGNGIVICGEGYYKVTCNVVLSTTTAGNVTVTALKDGVAIPGATATVTGTATGISTLPVSFLSRLICSGSSSTLTFAISGVSATVTNVAVVVEKL